MVCSDCNCNNCIDYRKVYCPGCDHHYKYHRGGGCTQPTCQCKKNPVVTWEKSESKLDGDDKNRCPKCNREMDLIEEPDFTVWSCECGEEIDKVFTNEVQDE